MSRATGTNKRPTAGAMSAYAAASHTSQELAGYRPPYVPADTAINGQRDKILARVHDLVRNDGWASGGVTSYLDSVIGADLRLSVKPRWRALQALDSRFDAAWAKEFAKTVEALWWTWANDIQKFSDAARQNTIGELFCLAFRHRLLDGDAVALGHYDPNRSSQFATFLEVMHPARMSNPDGQQDTPTLRDGVARDAEFGAAIGYHFRGTHPGEGSYSGMDQFTWTYVPRERPWGRQNVIHSFEKTEAGQSRGVSRFAPIVERLKMLTQYDRTEVQAAVLNAVLAAYITSPFDHTLFENAMTPDDAGQGIGAYQEERLAFHNEAKTQFNGVRLPTLFPGEEVKFIDSKRPNQAFADFERQALRNIASGMGISYEQLSRDWSQTNYSSGRLALIEVWRSYHADREKFANSFATPVYALFLEEIMNKGLVPMPADVDFWDNPTAFSGCKWIGPARGWVDPTKEAQAAQIRMENGLSTLEDECAEQGKDWEDVIEQRARERQAWAEHGLPDPQQPVVKEQGGQDDAG